MTILTTTPPSTPKSRPVGSVPIRIILLCVALTAIAIAVHFTPIEAWLTDAHELRRAVHSLGFWKYPVTVLTVACRGCSFAPQPEWCSDSGPG
jgi:uncharacterized membrane protein YdjX (TVP38/TMEM64 family)